MTAVASLAAMTAMAAKAAMPAMATKETMAKNSKMGISDVLPDFLQLFIKSMLSYQ